jgi:hypothetical protein
LIPPFFYQSLAFDFPAFVGDAPLNTNKGVDAEIECIEAMYFTDGRNR